MSVVFFDVEAWEKDRVPEAIAGESVDCHAESLSMKTVERAAEAEYVSVFSWSVVGRDVLERMPRLKQITTRSTGFDHIDLEYCREHNISVSNVPGYGERTVAEHTFALMLALSRKIPHGGDRTRENSFSREGLRGFDLEGKTIGLIGVGKIGGKVVEIASAFAMNVIAYDPVQDDELARRFQLTYVASPDEILKGADVISLHAPSNDETRHLINMESISLIKPGALLINTARGDLVETKALIAALDQGILMGAGLDVIENERLVGEEAEVLSKSDTSSDDMVAILQNHMLLNNPKVLVTPHNAFNSEEAIAKLLNTTVDNIAAYIGGAERNLVG